MLPLQITLEGFMSYREAQTLRFEDAALWLLCGRNGAGKSTVFDAIKYALFATHRGGTQGADALIHHERSSLKVAFDFQSGADTYRVVRTRSRKSRPTVQALHLDGPGHPQPGRPEPLPETDVEEGFRRWLGTTLGLTEATFVASTLLQQGKSDALLEAPPAKRHEMLLEIVDLAPYEALSRKADERRREAQAGAELCERHLQSLPEIPTDTIATTRARLDEWATRLAALGPRRDELLQLVPRAERWQELGERTQNLARELEAFRALECDAPTIEANATRLEELDAVVPLLERAAEVGVRAGAAARRETEAHERAAVALAAIADANSRLERAREELAGSDAKLSALRTQRDAAREAQLRLAPVLQQLGEWDRGQIELSRIENELQGIGSSLDEELKRVEAALIEARDAERAVPVLRQLLTLGTEHKAAERKRAYAIVETENARHALLHTQNERAAAETGLAAATARLDNSRTQEVEARAHHETAQNASERFESVEGEARCGYCGQELSPEHRTWERERLAGELERATAALAQTEAELERATTLFEAARITFEQSSSAEREAQTRARDSENSLLGLEHELSRLDREINARRVELPLQWVKLRENNENDLAAIEDALAQTREQAASLTGLQARIGELQAARGRRDALLKEQVTATKRLAELEQSLGEDARPERMATLRESAQAAERIADEAARELQRLEPERQAILAQRETAERDMNIARESEAAASKERAGAQAQREEIGRAANELRAQSPDAWRERLEDALTMGNVEQWRDEQVRLRKTDALGALRRLQKARSHAAEIERAQQDTALELQSIPSDARRPAAQVRAAIVQLSEEAAHCEREHKAAEREFRDLESQHEARQSAEREAGAANRERDLHRLLSEALGRDGLQRHLLQEAEDAIVDHANAVLDRISSGALRLEVRRDGGGTSNNSASEPGRQKALDLVAYDAASGDGSSPIPTAFLSGSQKFRVAVALAIGIGNYATKGARRVESVIIDEGFGSLDAEGRGAMIEELHALGEILQRVIVVSHQEDFAAAFPNRYLIVQEDGASKARLQSGSE